MLSYVFKFLKKYGSPFLLVVQMDGSHYPYNIHSPDSLKKFLPETTPNCINAYDNTLIVTDKYLTRLYHFLNKNFPHTFMFFTPDHGQNFGGLNGRFNDNFTPDVFHNALIAFLPYKDTTSYRILVKKEKKLVSQADIFATLLALMKEKPQYRIDGISLLDTNKIHRWVTCSEYMPTFHNNPLFEVVDTSFKRVTVDCFRKSVYSSATNKTYPYKSMPGLLRSMLDMRCQRNHAIPIDGK